MTANRTAAKTADKAKPAKDAIALLQADHEEVSQLMAQAV